MTVSGDEEEVTAPPEPDYTTPWTEDATDSVGVDEARRVVDVLGLVVTTDGAPGLATLVAILLLIVR